MFLKGRETENAFLIWGIGDQRAEFRVLLPDEGEDFFRIFDRLSRESFFLEDRQSVIPQQR